MNNQQTSAVANASDEKKGNLNFFLNIDSKQALLAISLAGLNSQQRLNYLERLEELEKEEQNKFKEVESFFELDKIQDVENAFIKAQKEIDSLNIEQSEKDAQKSALFTEYSVHKGELFFKAREKFALIQNNLTKLKTLLRLDVVQTSKPTASLNAKYSYRLTVNGVTYVERNLPNLYYAILGELNDKSKAIIESVYYTDADGKLINRLNFETLKKAFQISFKDGFEFEKIEN